MVTSGQDQARQTGEEARTAMPAGDRQLRLAWSQGTGKGKGTRGGGRAQHFLSNTGRFSVELSEYPQGFELDSVPPGL